MGLAVSVGLLASAAESGDDPEELAWRREEFVAVNRVLAANGLPPHVEPESLPDLPDRLDFGSMPYSWLHHVRRAVAYALRPGETFRPLRKRQNPAKDPVYDDVLFSVDSHMICHSDCEGFYVPIDFPEPLYDDLGDDDPGVLLGGILGSSQAALRELVLAAPLIGISLGGGVLSDADASAICGEREGSHPHEVARKAWLLMFERLRHSVEYGAAVSFG